MQSFKDKWFITAVILLVFAGIVWLFGAAGFRIGDGFLLIRTGSVELKSVDEGSLVYLDDDRKRGKKLEGGGLLLKNVVAGTHTILVARDGHWPWVKKIDLWEQQALILSPFTVPKNPDETLVLEEDEQYTRIKTAVLEEVLPQKNNKRVSKDALTAIWAKEDNIMIEWLGDPHEFPPLFCNNGVCNQQIVALESDEDEIRSLDFYKNQSDVLLVG